MQATSSTRLRKKKKTSTRHDTTPGHEQDKGEEKKNTHQRSRGTKWLSISGTPTCHVAKDIVWAHLDNSLPKHVVSTDIILVSLFILLSAPLCDTPPLPAFPPSPLLLPKRVRCTYQAVFKPMPARLLQLDHDPIHRIEQAWTMKGHHTSPTLPGRGRLEGLLVLGFSAGLLPFCRLLFLLLQISAGNVVAVMAVGTGHEKGRRARTKRAKTEKRNGSGMYKRALSAHEKYI